MAGERRPTVKSFIDEMVRFTGIAYGRITLHIEAGELRHVSGERTWAGWDFALLLDRELPGPPPKEKPMSRGP